MAMRTLEMGGCAEFSLSTFAGLDVENKRDRNTRELVCWRIVDGGKEC